MDVQLGNMRTHARDFGNGNADEIGCGESSKLNNGDGTPVCSACSRKFPSLKSLYGHMKSHSKRQRRGVMEPPGAGCAASGKRGREEVSPEIPMDMMEVATILLEIGGNSGLAAGGSGEESEQNNVVEGIGSDPKKEMEDPDWDPGLGSGSGRFKCPMCKKAFASRKALAAHRLKHTGEESGRNQVSDPGPVVGNGSAREVGGAERVREEGSSVEPVPSYQQPLVGPTLGLDAQIPGIKLVVDLSFLAEHEDN